MEAARQNRTLTRFEQMRFAREVLRVEAQALLDLAEDLHEEFCEAAELLLRCSGSIVVTGMGKAGLIGQKLTATLASLGTRCHFLHPGEAIHGDLGRVQAGDVILALSFSGESAELIRILPCFRQLATPIIAVTGQVRSTLALSAAVTLSIGPVREACPHGLAPTTSTTAMLALGDALALVLGRLRGFSAHDFARNHPGGQLGRRLARVDDVMRGLADCRVAQDRQSIREVLIMASRPGRRTGAIMLVNAEGTLTGLFTDSDLARLLERRGEHGLDSPIGDVMTKSPTTVRSGSWMSLAVGILVQRKISELPIVDEQGRPVGLIDITDVVAWLPGASHATLAAESAVVNGSDPAGDEVASTVPFPNFCLRQSRK